jgi:PAS domain S-box-containing protein
MTQETTVRRRMIAYVAVGLTLILANGLLRTSTWHASPAFHTLMEVIATVLASIVGVIALVRYYSQKSNMMLLIGTGFIGAALLDGYHAVVTSWVFAARFPSPPPSLVPWSWFASHLFLSVLLWWSWLTGRSEGRHHLLNERVVFGWVAMLTLATGVLFALVPLPRAIYPELLIPRPQELIPAGFLLAALAGYLRKGGWEGNVSEHWLVLSMLVGLLGLAPSMALSSRLHDSLFQGAHWFKQLSYLSVLVGLVFSMYELFRKAEASTQELDNQVKSRTAELAQAVNSLRAENTERSVAEESLRQSERRTRAILDTALDAVIGMDAGGLITHWNPRAEAIFGWARSEAIGRRLSDTIIPPQSREAHQRGLQRFLATGEGPVLNRRIEVTALRRDGTEFPVELSISPLKTVDSYSFNAFIADISGRKQAERRLAAQYAVTQVLAESSTLQEASPKLVQAIGESLDWEVGAIWTVDRDANLLRCLEVWHVPQVEVGEFVEITRQRTFLRGIGLAGRVWARGEPAWIPDVVQDPNLPRSPVAAKVGLHAAIGFPIKIKESVYGVIEFFSRQIREPDGELLQMVADIGTKIGRFIERKQAEDTLRQIEAQLQRAQKMEAIGQLAGGVAHEFNNLLTVVTGYCEFLLLGLGPHDARRKEVTLIKQAAEQAVALTQQLLAMSRQQPYRPRILNLNESVINAERMLRPLLGETVTIQTVLDPAQAYVKADPAQMEHVLLNLALNARDTMPDGGQFTIRTKNVDRPSGQADPTNFGLPETSVLLEVSDTGCGMDAEAQAHIFEPFFTAEEPGRSRWLGLAPVHGIVKQNGGSIEVDSAPGKGTTVRIYLLRIAPDAEAGTAPAAAALLLPSRTLQAGRPDQEMCEVLDTPQKDKAQTGG